MEIRQAYITDLDELLVNAETFMGLLDMELEIDHEYLKSVFVDLIRRHIILVAVHKDKIVGSIAGLCTSSMFDRNTKIVSETFWWMMPDSRGTTGGYKLLKEFEKRAKATNCKYITLSRLAKSPVQQATYEKAGYNITEETWVKRI